MRPAKTLIIGRKDILRTGLVATLRDSHFGIIRELSIEEKLPKAPSPNSIDLVMLIESQDQPVCLKSMVTSLRHRFTAACIVVISEAGSDQWTMADDIDACLPRSITSRALLLALELLLCKEVTVGKVLSPFNKELRDASTTVEVGSSATLQTTLSMREQEILKWLARGQSNKAIARGLAIEEATVKAHVRTVLRKTGASNRTQAAIMAHDWLVLASTNPSQSTH